MSGELKPCPFCGELPVVVHKDSVCWLVQCTCGAAGAIKSTSTEAIAAWNRRHTMTWMHDVGSWECPNCHAVFGLDGGNPEDKYLNFCPVCGVRLKLPE